VRLGGAAGAPPSPSGAPGFAAASGADLMEEKTGVEKTYFWPFSAPLALQRAHSETCKMFTHFKQNLGYNPKCHVINLNWASIQ